MGVDTKLTMEEYKELEKKFILHCSVDSDSTDYSLYVDNKKKLTFGIGFNIEDNPNWLAIALLYKFSGLKPIEEINKIGYQKDVLLYGNGKYNKFIEENCKGISADNKVLQIMRKYKTAKNTKVKNIDKLSKEIQKLIDEYNKRSDIEKIPVNDFSFEFTDEEISLIYDIGKKEYENQLAKYLTGTGKPFNIHSIKDTKLYISLLSFTYQQGGGNLEEHSNIFQGVAKSRFLIWFTLRYNVLSFTRQYKRRLHESTLFGLIANQAVDTKKADIPATILDVFSYLNFFIAGGDNTYLSYIKTNNRCKTMDIKAVDDGLVLFNRQSRYDVIKNSLQTVDFIKDFFSDVSCFKGKFLDNIIDFASHSTIFSIFTKFIEESFVKEIENKKGSEELFLLENIYVIDCINKNDFKLLLEQKYSGLQKRCNVLIFLNSTSDIVNDISYLQAKCPNVYFTIAIQEGYTYSFRLDEKSSTQTNIILYKIKDGKYIPELIKETFKAENISNEESQDEKNILLFSAENSKNLSGRLSNNTNIFHISHKSEDDIISKIKLYNMISDKYEGNIKIDMQGKEYDVSADKSSGYFTIEITLNVLDEALNDEDINNLSYYMHVNDTGEIFESKISNGKVSFGYCPTASCKNQKVLFSFNTADFASKKTANGKSLDYAFINKSSRDIKKTERTFTINLSDLLNNCIEKIELSNYEELSTKDDPFVCEHHFNAYTFSDRIDKIQWGYFTIPLNKLNILYDRDKIVNDKEINYMNNGDCVHFTPSSVFNEEQRKQLQQNQEVIIVVATIFKSFIFLNGQQGLNFYIIRPDNEPTINSLKLSEKYTTYYGRTLHVTNLDTNATYLYHKDPKFGLKGKPKDDTSGTDDIDDIDDIGDKHNKKYYVFGMKVNCLNMPKTNHDLNNSVKLKWLKINVMTSYKAGETDEEKKEKESSLKNVCKEILNKYKNNPLDIDFASLSKNNIEVTGNVSIIAVSNRTKTSACKLIEDKYQGTIIYNEDENIYYYVLNKGEQEGAVILCPFIDKPVLEEGKYIQLGFNAEDIAHYMAREIENNLKSAKAYEIKTLTDADRYIDKELLKSNNIIDIIRSFFMVSAYQNNYTGIVAAKYGMFYDAVKTDSFWDHKWQLSALFPSMGLSRRYHHVYDDKDIPYDAWSNIHFGTIGKYCEFSEGVLLGGADLAQKWSNRSFEHGDTVCDQVAIKLGFSIYDEYIKSILINAYNILSYVVNDNVFKYYFQNGKCPDE